ncbi:biopolymer transporter ExbD [Aquimarina sp. AD1]|uniref:ExbD/TolR family protein n=1 Tax=Aquimarina sp. (strain AD1) TaxID=1714848 RepID=UPI000E46EED0|nr:biopolymer transporter ExbD [Aquimarina sp. AD1]AXT57757.1 biopolymer transporter ExbD [Aquimarina sp. AD1]RKN29817.1 biopolymer transporter ExbD [Aquimarina sp. AD1]
MARRLAPEVNAGSMADIAFLLLIFFLVSTTIETDYGISRRLPPPPEDIQSNMLIKEKNLFRVELNQLNELFVEKKPLALKDLKTAAIAFLDNGGGVEAEYCSYCRGARDPKSSDNPDKAVISLVNSRETNYETYIAVQNELISAYEELRNREALRVYGMSFKLMKAYLKDANYSGDKTLLKDQIKQIRLMYPEKLSEAEPVTASL